MNNQIRTALTTLGFAGLFCGVMLRAQNLKSEIANVPFAFQVGSAVMPAGTYSADLTIKWNGGSSRCTQHVSGRT